MPLAWERYVDELAKEQQWIEIMAMRSGMGQVFVQRFGEVLQHFKRHVQAVGNEKDIQTPSDAKRYFCFFNTPGSPTFASLVAELQKPVDKGKYKFEDRNDSISTWLCLNLWKARKVTWTIRTQEDYDTAVKEGWLPIFEYFKP